MICRNKSSTLAQRSGVFHLNGPPHLNIRKMLLTYISIKLNAWKAWHNQAVVKVDFVKPATEGNSKLPYTNSDQLNEKNKENVLTSIDWEKSTWSCAHCIDLLRRWSRKWMASSDMSEFTFTSSKLVMGMMGLIMCRSQTLLIEFLEN